MSVVGDDGQKVLRSFDGRIALEDFFFFSGHIFANIFASKILSPIASLMGKSWYLVLICTSPCM